MEEECFNFPENGGKLRKFLNNNKNGRHNQEEEDKLSSLFDPLLIEILSLLPIESAAATSALSRRRRHLWTHITTLRFSSCKHFSAVNHILPQLTSPLIRALVLPLADDDEDEDEDEGLLTSSIDSCFDHIRCRNDIEKIEVIVGTPEVKLPAWVFQSQSLLSLNLGGYWNFELIDTNFSLPNLKNISLALNYSARSVIETLFASCPLLEVVWVEFLLCLENEQRLVHISAPNLKSLTIELCHCAPMRLKFVINAPKLFDLSIGDHFSSSHFSFVTIPSALVKAHIGLFPEQGEDEGVVSAPSINLVPDLVRAITSVGSLKLRDCSVMLNYLGCMNDGALSMFRNLTLLEMQFYEERGCWKDLLLSLRCFPNLEVLKVLECPSEEEDLSGLVSLPSHSLSKLKILEITGLPVHDSDKLLIGYILSNANALEKLCVGVNVMAEQKEIRLWKEYEFCETLFKLPRSSPTCHIVFNGAHIHASRRSSNAFSDGFLACHLLYGAPER